MAHIGKVKIADVEFLDLSQHSPRKFSLYASIVIEVKKPIISGTRGTVSWSMLSII